jgi:FtsZ-binding cell division protein ZapB
MKLSDLIEVFKGHDKVLFKLTGIGETEYGTIEFKDAIDTIEALQQENEQLRAKLDEWKYEVKCHMDEVVARDKQIEKLRAHAARLSAKDGGGEGVEP